MKRNDAKTLPPSATGDARRGGKRGVAVAVSVVLALALFLGIVHFLLRVFEPTPAPQSSVPIYHYDMAAMQKAVDWEHVKKRQDDILAFGSRFLGQPGMRATEKYIKKAYEDAGLEVHEQENWTVVPRTIYREIYEVNGNNSATLRQSELADLPDLSGQSHSPDRSDGSVGSVRSNDPLGLGVPVLSPVSNSPTTASAKSAPYYGHRLSDVEIFPFMPNHLQPITTPDDGIVGKLVVLDEKTLETRPNFSDCIGLIDAADGKVDSQYGYDWSRYAQTGIKALIVAHPDGLDRIPWKQVADEQNGMVSSVPINFVRLAATKGIFNHIGQRIRLRVRMKFQETENTTLVGVLHAGKAEKKGTKESALVLLTNYDADSILPDRAPGVAQAIPVATQLALLDGLTQYRDSLVRDVIFVAFGAQVMARDGDNNLLKLLDLNILKANMNPLKRFFSTGEPQSQKELKRILAERTRSRLAPWIERRDKNATDLRRVDSILSHFSDPAFLSDADATEKVVNGFDSDTAKLFQEQIQYVLDTIVFQLNEPMLQAKLHFLEEPGQDLEGPAFQAYLKAKGKYDAAVTYSGFGLSTLLKGDQYAQAFLRNYQVRERWKERFEELKAYHERLRRELRDNLDFIRVFDPYSQLLVFDNKMVPATDADTQKEELSFTDGAYGVNSQMRQMASLLSAARQRVAVNVPALPGVLKGMEVPALTNWHFNDVDRMTQPMSNMSSTEWTLFGYHMYTMLSFDRVKSYQLLNLPVDLPFMHDVKSLRYSNATVAEMLLSVAHGNGRFPPIQLGWLKKHFGGRVLASNVGQSVVPHYPVEGAVLASRSFFGMEYSYPGYYEHPLIMTNPYGRYELFNCASDFWVNHYIWKYGYSPVAAAYGRDGRIAWMKDEGETGQRLYKSVNINWFDAKVDNITLVLFRASPIALLDLTNPQKMTDFSGVRLLDSKGVVQPPKFCQFRVMPNQGLCVTFVEPEEAVYIALESGSPGNDLAKVVRGFLLNIPGKNQHSNWKPDPTREINGPGYLAVKYPILENVPLQMARSMAFLNEKRLKVQERYDMADELIKSYNAKAEKLLAEAEQPHKPEYFRTLDARDSVTYSMLNHPVLRETITEAVIGILYFLALLVPFVFFFEKMVFCFTDIRKQLAAQAVIFLVVFGLLRALHPAFSMIRSSLMILLGFVIILISGSMTILFSGKFQQNLTEIRKRRGLVAGAQINRLGVLSSAFMLGLNNMHRRKVRTALTCGTLSLMTFAMICFTSVHTDIVNEETAIGKAPYQGLLLKRQQFRRFTNAEVFAIESKYSHKFDVCPRKMTLGTQNWLDKQGYNPVLDIVYNNGKRSRHVRFNSIIQMTYDEPLQKQIRILTHTPWFSRSQQDESSTKPCPVMIPNEMAESLGITPKAVEAGGLKVQINGRTFVVQGIFDSQSLANARDLDNEDILPYNIEAMPRVQLLDTGEVAADENSPRLPPRKIILAPYRSDLGIQIPNAKEDSNCSIALYMPNANYKQARAAIDEYLEESERPAYFGLDGVAYHGRRARKSSLSGLVDMIVPLLIVALTVLNTMKGSVYERRDEIAVYNAVGIAPRYVFFMFFAEAFVYAVVGSLLGYLLSQGTGRILTALHLTGGMNMTFTSITTIYASLAIVATVFLSTWFPARTAMEIAQPAEEAGWKLPEPEGDILGLDLPFTFNYRDRVAVLAFCNRFLEDHGEGGSGRFFAGRPVLSVSDERDPLNDNGYIPTLTTPIWLKPYDLGVNQRMTVTMPTDQATREFKARLILTRLSGARDAWLRLNHRFVAEIRRQFLHWRAVSEEDRQKLFEEARTLIIPPNEEESTR